MGSPSPSVPPVPVAAWVDVQGIAFEVEFSGPLAAATLNALKWQFHQDGYKSGAVSAAASGSFASGSGMYWQPEAGGPAVTYAGGDAEFRGANGALIAPFTVVAEEI